MGIATHLGPWLLGTVKNTTGTTVGLIRNVGATNVSQTTKVVYDGTTVAAPKVTTIAVLPAGAQIVDIKVDTLVAFTTSTAANLTIGDGTTANLYWATQDILAIGRNAYTGAATKLLNWCGAATTASPNGAGIGTTDVKVTATLSPATSTVGVGTVQYTVIYTVANADGTTAPTSFTGP